MTIRSCPTNGITMKFSMERAHDNTAQHPIQLALVDAHDQSPMRQPSSAASGSDHSQPRRALRAAEFFAGIGLVRVGLESAGIDVVWANDLEPIKHAVYASNFDDEHFVVGDIRDVAGASVPSVDIATASFPCVDLSLAGHRRGLAGEQSGLFYEFVRVLREMGWQMPSVVMIENVPSFVSSRGGSDLYESIKELNTLGYICDVMTIDARWFVPQSRPRLFIIGTRRNLGVTPSGKSGPLRSESVASFIRLNRDLMLQELLVPIPIRGSQRLNNIVESLGSDDNRWWDHDRMERFLNSLSLNHQERLSRLQKCKSIQWRTAYRRTRNRVAVWEIRADEISGCLRTARGGSSRQAVVQVSDGEVRARWMTPREYARLQGVSDQFDISAVSEAQALFGFGDAVCVPVISWLAQHVLAPAAEEPNSTCTERNTL